MESMQPKYLRLVQAGYQNYTGPIGAYDFVDGVSTVMIPRNDRDRLATAFQFVEFITPGDEIEAGVAARLLFESTRVLEVPKDLERQTEAEKADEDKRVVEGVKPDPVIYTAAELEAIAEKKGINGLREVAAYWEVKHRSIVPLMELILGAQAAWLDTHQAKFEKRVADREAFEESLKPETAAAETPAEDTPAETPEPEQTADTSTEDAAATGDLSAALNQE